LAEYIYPPATTGAVKEISKNFKRIVCPILETSVSEKYKQFSTPLLIALETVCQSVSVRSKNMSEPSLLEVLHANLLSETAVRMSCQGQRLQVHEIASSTGNYFEDEENHGPEAEAIALACWNCGACSHRYQECLGEKKVFCYGCGKPETYKPSCNRCNGKKKTRKPVHHRAVHAN